MSHHPHTQVKQGKQHINHHEETHGKIEQSMCSVCNNKRPNFEWKKRDFKYCELHAATEGFSAKNFLSEGGFGSVYKGMLCGQIVAIKKHKCETANSKEEKEFKSEVDALSKARHENVVMLLGSCSEGSKRLLVYEYVCNDSLAQHLSQHSRKVLSWQDRVKVATGAAKGLLYLHENNIIHRDMTPNNILLTHDYEVLLGDFGLARTVVENSSYCTECVGGNLAYMAPEYAESGKVSIKTDVYSFGVVLLQLITGMKTTDKRVEEKGLVGWTNVAKIATFADLMSPKTFQARPLLKEGKCQELIDGRMINSHDCHQLYWMSRLAGFCLLRDPHKRLHMSTVVKALNEISQGCSCIVRREHVLAMPSHSKSKR